ncbi:phenylacetyl-CoA ligase [Cylindrobasidium torrendii FP15055 ss-10]|uniref:Phenylacetyl-CoA ligase n=1 Tax=Cylindrobasidium torrendii FP15055 ss-10 TaxID=1314674 RepID=A0A0D7B0I1_9AGAR|nr:phenylacetyl-CoA ligase [Cylindrobasidium torrendii FP15055 ss-10]
MEFSGPPLALNAIPNLTIPQFTLDYNHPLKKPRGANVPVFIEDATGRGITLDEARARVHHLANALHTKFNIAENDVVCIFSPNDIDYPVSIWAIHRLGAVVTPANPSYTHEELQHQLDLAQANTIFVNPASLGTALKAAKAVGIPQDRIVLMSRSERPEGYDNIESLVALGKTSDITYTERALAPGEAKTKTAFLSFSSGTTGRAKAVVIPHAAVISNVVQMAIWFSPENDVHKRMAPGDVSLGALPFFHIYGLVVTLHFMLFNGISVVVIPKFNFSAFLKSIVRHKITHLFIVPPQAVLLTKHAETKKYNLAHVKLVMCGAAPLSGDLVEAMSKLFPDAMIGQGYGLTESSTTIVMLNPKKKVDTIGSAGRLIPGIVARIVKEDGSLCKEGEQGELVVKSPALALRYHGNEQATAETFVDGWLRTGDEVIVKDGDFFVVDRLKEMFKVRGFQVAPAELEGHLLTHPAVADVCVVGIPDEYSGEIPLAFVVPQSSAVNLKDPSSVASLKNAISKHVSDNKIQYKWLAGGVEFIDAIPKNPSGKILRRILRAQATKNRITGSFSLQAKL